MSVLRQCACFLVVTWLNVHNVAASYNVDGTSLARTFDGVGAVSGGGATSKLLVNYPEPQRSQILDYLFKPEFGAALQILKVEIGGDSQSTDGAESSHMHNEDDISFHRGYEWWLMKEAKKRNPSIRLYGLPWVFPGWLGGPEKKDPYDDRDKLLNYMLKWIGGAQTVHNLTIDYIGIWNERPYDIQFIKMLRRGLNEAGFCDVQIVGGDSASWNIVKDVIKDDQLKQDVDIIGVHYPGLIGLKSPAQAVGLNKPLWASEEYSAINNMAGAACWARILTEDYLQGYYTAFIAWNLVSGYYDNLPYGRSSLMTANQPWSGHYQVAPTIWITAHVSQFVERGWRYLPHGEGVGRLHGNGSYTALCNPDKTDLTIIIQTMNPADAPCFYPMPKFTVSKKQSATFVMHGSFAKLTWLYVWYSHLDFVNESASVLLQKIQPVKVVNGVFSLHLGQNEIYTVTSLPGGNKGHHSSSPHSAPFPVPYQDNFEGYSDSAEPYNFAQQAGVFEIVETGVEEHGGVVRQVVTQAPVDRCRPRAMPRPITLIGDYYWEDVRAEVDFRVPPPPEGSSGVFLAARVSQGGCKTQYSDGVFCWIYPHNNSAVVTGNFSKTITYGSVDADVGYDRWYHMALDINQNEAWVQLQGRDILHFTIPTVTHGFVAIGTDSFAAAEFDNFRITDAAPQSMSEN